jgi:hypothetical protein
MDRDRNKGAYKLNNFGPVYCINLDGQPERWDYMEEQFKYWELKDYTRISAYDGRDDDLSGILKGKYPDNITSGEIGCTTSHLKALKHYLDNSDAPYAIIMEDDCDMEVVRFWNFTWADVVAHFPYDYDVVQIAIICTGDIHVKLHKRFVNDFSTACYVIARHHAEKLVRLHCRGGYTGEQKYKIDQGVKPRPVADDLIYNSGNTFAIPLLMYKVELGSSIHPEHVDVWHKNSHKALWGWWSQEGAKINIADHMNYDPYLGRITENSAAKNS